MPKSWIWSEGRLQSRSRRKRRRIRKHNRLIQACHQLPLKLKWQDLPALSQVSPPISLHTLSLMPATSDALIQALLHIWLCITTGSRSWNHTRFQLSWHTIVWCILRGLAQSFFAQKTQNCLQYFSLIYYMLPNSKTTSSQSSFWLFIWSAHSHTHKQLLESRILYACREMECIGQGHLFVTNFYFAPLFPPFQLIHSPISYVDYPHFTCYLIASLSLHHPCIFPIPCLLPYITCPLFPFYHVLLLEHLCLYAYMHEVNPNIFWYFLSFYLCITFLSLFTHCFYFFWNFPYFCCHSIHLKSLSLWYGTLNFASV